MSNVPDITLNNGVTMPQLGFGVWQVPDDEAATAVATALEAGYRSIDTAALYRNEQGTGRAIAASGIPRGELFVTTKLWNTDQGHDNALRAFDASLGKLGLEYVDLYLIHWPAPARGLYLETWRALEKIHADGRARAIGVSNFPVDLLRHLLDEGGVAPVLNQVELHPHLPQTELRAFHAGHGIATEAWSPLGQGRGLLDEAGARRDRRQARQDPGPGRPALAPADRQRRDPQVRDPVADPGEHRRLRLRARRRGPGRDRRPRQRRAPRPGPVLLQLTRTRGAAACPAGGRPPRALTRPRRPAGSGPSSRRRCRWCPSW